MTKKKMFEFSVKMGIGHIGVMAENSIMARRKAQEWLDKTTPTVYPSRGPIAHLELGELVKTTKDAKLKRK